MRGAVPALHEYVMSGGYLVKLRNNFTYTLSFVYRLWGQSTLLPDAVSGAKWPGREADHLPLPSTEDNSWCYTSTH